MMSKEQALYLKKRKRNKLIILLSQISLLVTFIGLWELLSKYELINSFIFSSPSKIILTLINLYKDHNLFPHIYTTSMEVIVSFSLSTILGFILALFFYIFPTIKKIMDPFITMINSLPKVALGPLIIIWLGANTESIIFMALLINLIVTFSTILNGFIKEFGDIYELEHYKDAIIEMDGFGEKSYENLIENIKKSSHTTLPRLVYALGIANIGVANIRVTIRKACNESQKTQQQQHAWRE